MEPSLDKSVALSSSESRLVLQAISSAADHERRCIQVCERERPSGDIVKSLKARQQQIVRLEQLRDTVVAQL